MLSHHRYAFRCIRILTLALSIQQRTNHPSRTVSDRPVPPPYGLFWPRNEGDREFFSGERLLAEDTTTDILGTLPIPSGQLLVTDPCYETRVGERIWRNAVVECVPHDAYQVRMVTTNDEYNDVVSFGVFHPNYLDMVPNEVAHDNVGVDSATISFSDKDHKVPLCEFKLFEHDSNLVNWYGGKVAATVLDDGGYLLLVGRNEEDKVVAAEVLEPYFLKFDKEASKE